MKQPISPRSKQICKTSTARNNDGVRGGRRVHHLPKPANISTKGPGLRVLIHGSQRSWGGRPVLVSGVTVTERKRPRSWARPTFSLLYELLYAAPYATLYGRIGSPAPGQHPCRDSDDQGHTARRTRMLACARLLSSLDHPTSAARNRRQDDDRERTQGQRAGGRPDDGAPPVKRSEVHSRQCSYCRSACPGGQSGPVPTTADRCPLDD